MLNNLNVIPSFDFNGIVKVKVEISIDSTCKVKRSYLVVVEYSRNSVPIFNTISL